MKKQIKYILNNSQFLDKLPLQVRFMKMNNLDKKKRKLQSYSEEHQTTNYSTRSFYKPITYIF